MGCDIHMVVQKLNGKKWEDIDAGYPCRTCESTGKLKNRDGATCYWCDGRGFLAAFETRTYDTFAILADVRNAFGGKDGEPLTPIAPARGLPYDIKDVSTEDDGRFGDHSFSWLMLSELIDWPHWEDVVTKRGWIDEETFRAWDAAGGGWPKEWSGSVGGGRVRHISNEELRAIVSGTASREDRASYYTLVEWKDTHARCAREFHDSFIPALMKLGAPNEVRIVFGFDS